MKEANKHLSTSSHLLHLAWIRKGERQERRRRWRRRERRGRSMLLLEDEGIVARVSSNLRSTVKGLEICCGTRTTNRPLSVSHLYLGPLFLCFCEKNNYKKKTKLPPRGKKRSSWWTIGESWLSELRRNIGGLIFRKSWLFGLERGLLLQRFLGGYEGFTLLSWWLTQPRHFLVPAGVFGWNINKSPCRTPFYDSIPFFYSVWGMGVSLVVAFVYFGVDAATNPPL